MPLDVYRIKVCANFCALARAIVEVTPLILIAIDRQTSFIVAFILRCELGCIPEIEQTTLRVGSDCAPVSHSISHAATWLNPTPSQLELFDPSPFAEEGPSPFAERGEIRRVGAVFSVLAPPTTITNCTQKNSKGVLTI